MTKTGDGVEIEHGMPLYTCAGKLANRPLLVPYHLDIGKLYITVVNGTEEFEIPNHALFSSSMSAAKARLRWLDKEIEEAKGHIGYADIVSPFLAEKQYLEKVINWQGEFLL